MNELVIQPRSTIKVKVGEQTFEVKKPTNRQLKAFQDASKDQANSLEILLGMLADLGLPLDVSWELGPQDIEALVEMLVPKKKQ